MNRRGTYCKVKKCEGIGGYKEMQGYCADHWQRVKDGENFECGRLRHFGNEEWDHHECCGWCSLSFGCSWIMRAICCCGVLEYCIYFPFVVTGNE